MDCEKEIIIMKGDIGEIKGDIHSLEDKVDDIKDAIHTLDKKFTTVHLEGAAADPPSNKYGFLIELAKIGGIAVAVMALWILGGVLGVL